MITCFDDRPALAATALLKCLRFKDAINFLHIPLHQFLAKNQRPQ